MIELSAFLPVSVLTKYIGVISVLGFGAMVWDKLMARAGGWRLSERSLAGIAMAGGFLGIIVGGLIAHHKTSKPEFWPPVALATLPWLVFLIAYFDPRVLPL